MSIKLSTQEIHMMATFEHVTGITATDCIVKENNIYFFVEHKIVVKKSYINTLRRIFGKNVWLIKYYSDMNDMLKNLIPQIKHIEKNNSTVTISIASQDRWQISGKNIAIVREILAKRFKIKDLKINYHPEYES
jgi:NusA-like KH domain protein